MGNAPYQAPRWAPGLIVPLLAGLMALWVRFAPPSHTAGASRLRMDLPAELGAFSGQRYLYCQNEQCLKAIPVPEGATMSRCPVCAGPLHPMALGERTSLPVDTQIARRIYHGAGLQSYTVTIVLAGADPRSIHRPQQCLSGQGYTIDREQVRTLRLAPDRTLSLAVIDTRRGSDPRNRFGFAYWFVGPDRETHSHWVRLFRTTTDRLFRNIVSRWAYVAITSSEPLDSPESLDRLAAFIRLLLPAIESNPDFHS